MAGFIVKLFVCPIFVILASFVFPNVNYATIYQPIIVGLILAIAGHTMELVILKKGTLWISTVADFVAATIIVYYASLLFPTATVTIGGAVLTAIALTISEMLQHLWLIQSGRTNKSHA
ncbi:DUF2512 family protein [Bacillus alkalicellulosilyticus]|uniref:DUF2512 family protein n=1 Tax=Alkalihalobacterium alkalicellulosilyticum TaxID=1912214 RepID=UPI000996773C|nr:DUF2512 family protein [Bacillus alkalicellulosilyticus]